MVIPINSHPAPVGAILLIQKRLIRQKPFAIIYASSSATSTTISFFGVTSINENKKPFAMKNNKNKMRRAILI